MPDLLCQTTEGTSVPDLSCQTPASADPGEDSPIGRATRGQRKINARVVVSDDEDDRQDGAALEQLFHTWRTPAPRASVARSHPHDEFADFLVDTDEEEGDVQEDAEAEDDEDDEEDEKEEEEDDNEYHRHSTTTARKDRWRSDDSGTGSEEEEDDDDGVKCVRPPLVVVTPRTTAARSMTTPSRGQNISQTPQAFARHRATTAATLYATYNAKVR